MNNGIEVQTGDAVCHIVAKDIASEFCIVADVIEQVLAGKLGCLIV